MAYPISWYQAIPLYRHNPRHSCRLIFRKNTPTEPGIDDIGFSDSGATERDETNPLMAFYSPSLEIGRCGGIESCYEVWQNYSFAAYDFGNTELGSWVVF